MITAFRTPTGMARALEAQRSEAKRTLYEAVATARLAYLTDLPFQDMIYLRKEQSARACLADPTPDPAHYPILAAELAFRGPTVTDVATVIVSLADFFEVFAAAVEALRFSTEASLSTATSKAEIDAIMDALPTAISALPTPPV